jgi:hypothetical protein
LSSYIRWVSTEKNTTLESQLTTDTYIIYENGDIIASTLNAPRFFPEAYNVEVPISLIELNAINDNPNGLIKLADGKYGWIMEFKYKIKEAKADIRLLRYNSDEVTPV